MKKNLRTLGVVVFGAVFPILMLIQSYIGINSLRSSVGYTTQLSDLAGYLASAQESLKSVDDYSLYSLLYVEHANQKTMINKQVMKSTIVLIGFAVVSIGIMLIILGIGVDSRESVEAGVEIYDVKFDFKTGSVGVAIFVVGALMATVGGVLKNDYQTSQIPHFIGENSVFEHERSLEAYEACKSQENEFGNCFSQIFYQINQDRLK